MKRFILPLVALLLSLTGAAAPTSDIIAQADSAYTAEDYPQAAQLYLGAISQEGPSAKLYYNLGNTYYRLGEMGNAILSYERALRLDPADKDVRENLAFVNARITDRPGERGTFLGNALDAAASASHSNTWAWLALACFVLVVAGVLAYLYVDAVAVRKTGFFGAIVAFILCCWFIFLAYRGAARSLSDDVAIVISPSSILSTVPRTPSDRSQEAMLLHEGTRVEILDSVSSTAAGDSVKTLWYDVQVDNAHRAWINATDVEKI